MKRTGFAALLAVLLLCAAQGSAARARYLSSDGDTAFHTRHLSMHIGDESCRACGNYLKVRRSASGNGAVVGHVEQADLLRLLSLEGNWARISVLYSADTSPDSWPGLTGYVDASYLECGCEERAYYGGYTDAVQGGEILSGGVNLRELPTMSSRSLGKCTRSERVRVLGRYVSGSYTFYRVVRYSGQNGFVSGEYLSLGGSAPRFSYDSGSGSYGGGSSNPAYGGDDGYDSGASGGVRATTGQLRVRETPGGAVIGHISSEDTLQLLERSGGWARIRVTAARSWYEDCYTGLTGWVSTDYLSFGSSSGSGGGASASFAGSYSSSDGNTLSITRSGAGYRCELSIYRLTSISAYGSDQGGWLDMTGSDASGYSVRFVVTMLSGGGVMVTITDTSWMYLSNGQTFTFQR